MLWRHLGLARAWLAAGVLTSLLCAAPALAEPEEPSPASGASTETVAVLDARRAGDLAVEVRGSGQERVRLSLRNTSSKRLNVVIPPGLVASSAVGQAPAGGGGGGRGGFQSMGLGTTNNRPGSFGQFRTEPEASAFRSVPVRPEDTAENTVTVPAGRTIEIVMPAVCLNFGLPTPTARDRFELMDVTDYTSDPRARRALRSLATLGTSHGVAQAAAWHVFNGVPFEVMSAQAGKCVNVHEVALAARFTEALDASGESDVVDTSYLSESRIFVRVQGEGALAGEAKRLGQGLEGLRLLGLPVRVVDDRETPTAAAPALEVAIVLTSSKTGETRGRIVLNRAVLGEGWTPFGRTTFTEGSTVSVLDGPGLAKAVDHAIAAAFVSIKVAHRGTSSTTLRIENRLPFTLANVLIRTGGSSGAPAVPFKALGVGPARSATAAIQAASGTVDRIELNGL